MRASRILAVAIVSAFFFAAVPADAQELGIKNPIQSTETKLYFHINGFQEFPINTQKPDDSFSASVPVGLSTQSTSCLPETEAGTATSGEWHTSYGYSSPGYVQYDVIQDGKPRYHPERGISYDADLDAGAPSIVYWYLETQVGAGDPDNVPINQAPVIIPNVEVRATIRAADTISPDNDAYNSAPLIAQGTSGEATLALSGTTGAVYQQVGDKHVYEFAVPLTYASPVIPRDTGYNMRIDVYIKNDICNDPDAGYIMPNLVRTHTSPDLRPRWELSVMNPVRIEYLHPQFVGDELVVHTSSNSVWGNYDVAEEVGPYGIPGGITITIDGPSPATPQQAAFTQRTHEHDAHQEAVDITYVWPYKDEGARNGEYTVSFVVKNDQETATATGVVAFNVGEGTVTGCGEATTAAEAHAKCETEVQEDGETGGKDSPGAGLLVLLALLGGALLARRK